MFEVIDTDKICMGCMESNAGHNFCPHCGWRRDTPSRAHHIPAGSVLGGEILLGRVLGEGGFGITYIGLDLNLNKKLAVKEYFPRDMAMRAADGESVSSSRAGDVQSFAYGLSKFREEARTLARLDHEPGIVSVLRYLDCNGTGYLVMPFIEGMTFQQFLESHGGKISFPVCLQTLTPVLETLQRLHKVGLLHRDLSPDNIYLPNGGSALLFDFGAARQAGGEAASNLSVIVKCGYAPEEQYRREGLQGPWTDVYGFAATFYRALTGKAPVGALERLHNDQLVPPSALGATLPPPAEAALMQALAVKADRRLGSAAELLRLLGPGNRPTQATLPKPGASESGHRPKSLLRLALGLSVVFAALAYGARPTPVVPSPPPTPTPSIIEKTPPSATPAVAVVPTPTLENSNPYTSPEGRFSVIVPLGAAAPKISATTKVTPQGKLVLNFTSWPLSNGQYSVIYMDFSPEAIGQSTIKERILKFQEGSSKQQKVEMKEFIKVQRHEALITRFSAVESDGYTMYGRSMIVIDGPRVYYLMYVSVNRVDISTIEVDRFFDYFELL